MPLFLRQRIELKPFQAWDVVSPRPLLTILNSASLSLLSDSVPDPPLPSSASVRLDPWGLLIPGPRSPGFSWRWPTETQVAGNHGASSLQRASRRSLPLCPPSTRISGFLTILCWAPPPCPWFWPVPQIMLSRQVAGVDSISSQNLTWLHLSFLFHSYLSPYTSWCLVIRKCYFFLPWDLPLPRQHHLQSSPLDWTSIQWFSKGVSIFRFMVFRQKTSAEAHTCIFSTHPGVSSILIFKTTHWFYGGLWELVQGNFLVLLWGHFQLGASCDALSSFSIYILTF